MKKEQIENNNQNNNQNVVYVTVVNQGYECVDSINYGLAALLSFFIPGLGQIYKGQLLNGICWFFFVILGYGLIVPGIILHICCVVGANSPKNK